MAPTRARRKTRRPHGDGEYWYDKQKRRHKIRVTLAGKTYTLSDPDRSGVEAQLRDLKAEVAKNLDRQGSKQPLRDFLLYWLETVIRRDVGESTYADYRKRFEIYVTPTLGDYPLCDLTTKLIRAWQNAARDTYAISSVKQARALLERALDIAVEERLIESNPAASVKPPKAPRRPDNVDDEEGERALSVAQVDRLLAEARRTDKLMSPATGPHKQAAAVRGDGLYLLYLIAVRLGLRRGELLGLRWRDIDFDNRIVKVRQQVVRDADGSYRISDTLKTPAARRELPLVDDLAQLLREHRLKLGPRANVKDLVFPDKTGVERDPNSITRNFARLIKRLGLGDYHLHDLRATAITRWREMGIDLEVAAAMAGHEKADVTADVYSDATMDRKRAALEKIAK